LVLIVQIYHDVGQQTLKNTRPSTACCDPYGSYSVYCKM